MLFTGSPLNEKNNIIMSRDLKQPKIILYCYVVSLNDKAETKYTYIDNWMAWIAIFIPFQGTIMDIIEK